MYRNNHFGLMTCLLLICIYLSFAHSSSKQNKKQLTKQTLVPAMKYTGNNTITIEISKRLLYLSPLLKFFVMRQTFNFR